jgi:hypothetical protein
MSRFPYRVLAIIGFSVTLWSDASRAEPGPNLIALIPPEAGLVAGMEAMNRDAERPHFLIPLPRKSLRDFNYFNSLCGADPAKSVDEVIFAGGDLDRSAYDHILLARGRFNSQILYRSSLSRCRNRAAA